MTRWARSGSTQKHKKMPGDATPWEEFSKQMKIQQNAGHSFKKKKKLKSFIKKCDNVSCEDSNKHMSLPQNESESEFANATMQNSFVKSLEGDDNKIMCKSSKRTHELDMSDFSPRKKKKMLKNKHDLNDISAYFIPVKHSELHAEENNDKKIYNNLKIIDGVAFASKKEFKKAMREEKIRNRINQKKLLKHNVAENAYCGDTKTEKVTDRNGSYSYFPTQNPESISHEKHRQDANSNINNIKSADEMTQLSKKQLKKEKRRKSMNMRNQDSTSSQNVKEKISENTKIEKDLNQEECDAISSSKTDVVDESNLKQGFKKVKNKKKVKKRNSSCQSSVDGKDLSTEEVNSQKVPEKRFTKMKESYLEKLQRKRAKNGMLLLPAKIERKLYNIKRALRAKGMPPGVIKEIIRKERRKEELNFRKTSISKICFNCRKPGHLFADCPVKLGESDQGTGICFKCGSTEHTSYKCPKNISGFPLAKCFICSQQGHISKDCPRNKHGIYPKGGKCSICGNVNHLRKDCPTLSKKNEEDTVTLHTINEWTSIDAEPMEDVKIPKKPNKKPKVVKF